jgi:membrane protease YdiL (CAAX protease family)
VSILQRQSVIRSLRKLDALLVVSVTLLFTAAPLVPPNAAIGAASGTAVLAVLAWYKRSGSRAVFDLLRDLPRPGLVRGIADIVEAFVPALPLGLLIAGGLIFSMLNAAVEEGAYRGVILHALDRSLGPGFAALLLQALAFGAIHIRGFPRGWLGIGLACIYGLLMGVIRRRAGGMFAPWIAHVFTDVVIAGIVVFLARPN